MNLSRISVKRPIAVTMVVMIFVVIGLYSLSMFSMELMPKMELSMALVYTSYPNVGSQEVENLFFLVLHQRKQFFGIIMPNSLPIKTLVLVV